MSHSTPRSPMLAAAANGLHGEGYFSAYEVLDPTPAALARAADLTATAESFERVAARYEAAAGVTLALHVATYNAQVNAGRAAAYHDLARRAAAPVVQRTCVPTLGCADKRAAKKRDRLRAAADIAEQIAPAPELDGGIAYEPADDADWDAFHDAGEVVALVGWGAAEVIAEQRRQSEGRLDTVLDWAEFIGRDDFETLLDAEEAIAEHHAEQVALAADGVWGDRLDAGDLDGFTISERPVGGTSGCTRPRDEAGRFVSTDPARIAAADARARILADQQARSWARNRRLAAV